MLGTLLGDASCRLRELDIGWNAFKCDGAQYVGEGLAALRCGPVPLPTMSYPTQHAARSALRCPQASDWRASYLKEISRSAWSVKQRRDHNSHANQSHHWRAVLHTR